MLKEYRRLYRIKDWLHFLALPVLGYTYVSKRWDALHLILLMVAAAFYLAYGYSLNEVFDKKKNKTELDGYTLHFHQGFALSLGALILGIVPLLFFSPFNRREILLVFSIGALSGYLYSAYPFRLKSKPFLGLIFNSLCFAPLFLLGVASITQIDFFSLLVFGYIFASIIPIQIIHEIAHFFFDKKEGIKNTVCVFGLELSKKFLSVSCTLLLIYSLLLRYFLHLNVLFFLFTLFFCVSLYIITLRFLAKGLLLNLKKVISILAAIYGAGLFYFLYKR